MKFTFLIILMITANVGMAKKTQGPQKPQPLDACIYHEKVIYKYVKSQAMSEDSVSMVRDTAWLFVNSQGRSQSFSFFVNDTIRVEDSLFVAGDTIGLNAEMRSLLGLNANEGEADSVLSFTSLRIVPDGQVSTYTKETIVEVVEEKASQSAVKNHNLRWTTLATIAALLLGLASLVCILAMKKKGKGVDTDDENVTSNSEASGDVGEGVTKQATKQERKGLKKQIDDCKAENKGLKKQVDELQSEVDKWKKKTGFDSPEKAETCIQQLQSDVKRLEKIEAENEDLKSIDQQLKDNPDAFEGKSEYQKLSQLIKKAHRCDQINDNPSLVDPNSETGVLVRQGRFLDAAMNDPKRFVTDTDFVKGSDVQKLMGCILKPFDICDTDYHKTGLYKLVADIQKILQKVANHEVVSEEDLTSNEEVKRQLKPLIDRANSYLHFDGYKNYWKNIRKPLLAALDDVANPQHDDNYKMRCLMFYASQFYSMAQVMDGIYENSLVSETYADNVAVFNASPALPNGEYGFPDIPEDSLQKYKFDYELHDERKKTYYSRFAPMKFIYVNVYYPDANA
jgi:nitrate/TMAO reductase-like tetraheme cytochrome c subunit